MGNRKKYSKKDFASYCGVSQAILSVNIKRNKVIVDENGFIDITKIVNVAFRSHRAWLKTEDGQKTLARVTSTGERINAEQDKAELQESPIVIWKNKRIIADGKKAEFESEIKRVQLEKALGRLIPVELLQSILKINMQSIFVGFEQELINIAAVYCDILANGDRKKLAEIIELMREALERIIKNTKKSASKEVELAIDDFREVRSRGERKA